ncbi:putative membrane protein, partial [Bordetella bronchiseptica MO211]
MTDRLAMRRQGGWSLLEAATLLAVAGLFGVMLWNLLPVLRQAGGAPAQQAALEQARQALTGFGVQSHGRLPWPAPPGSNDGLENAAAAGGAQALLPWKTLG